MATTTFKTFPEFSKLTISDRESYERLICNYPPISDISFGMLTTWWGALEPLSVSLLNDNLVISYWKPGVEQMSGIGLVGTHKVDESICDIFDYQKARGDKPRLVNVPEFVLGHIRYPELFTFHAQRSLDEYVYPVAKFYPLQGNVAHRRWRIRRFMADIDEDSIVIKELNLNEPENAELLLEKADEWGEQGKINSFAGAEREAIEIAIAQADDVGIHNISVFIAGKLVAFCLYQETADSDYIILSFGKFNLDIPRIFDFSAYCFAKWLDQHGVRFINADSDLGLPVLRITKLALGPTNFFRKYTITPAA